MLRTLIAFSFLLKLSVVSFAASPVDQSSALEEISTDFELCDGPAWDGNGTLFIPDVKGESLYRFFSRQNKLLPLLKNTGRFSASFYNNGQLFLSDNGNARIVTLNGKDLARISHRKNKRNGRFLRK
ncbi:hypothetical protein [Thalassoglobus sp.]|uniref:hypothetical protein n=1 Tax=Thalassoglobus sp. TaxID=2795869 RepID=UPI003AA8CEFC